MAPAYTSDELVSRLPGVLARLSEVAEYDIDRLREIALEEGLEHFPRPRTDDRRSLRLQHSADDVARLNRALRTAISKRLGTPTGTDKVYSSGPFIVGVTVADIVSVSSFPQRSLESIGAAAVAWMAGMPFPEWVDADGNGIMHPTERLIRAPRVNERPGASVVRARSAIGPASGRHRRERRRPPTRGARRILHRPRRRTRGAAVHHRTQGVAAWSAAARARGIPQRRKPLADVHPRRQRFGRLVAGSW